MTILECPNIFCIERSISSGICNIGAVTRIFCHFRLLYVQNFVQQLFKSQTEKNSMSIPIVQCRFLKAFTDEEALKKLAKDLDYNLKHHSMTILPCKHEPPCRLLTEEESNQLSEKIIAVLYEFQ
jgi:hypothetical protein